MRSAKFSGRIFIEPSAFVHWSVAFRLWGGSVTVGKMVFIDRGVGLHADGGSICIGNNSTLNANTLIIGGGKVNIGQGVLIAGNCVIVASNHNFSKCDVPIASQGMDNGYIDIEDDVWIGAGVEIVSNVRIGRGAVVGAGAVVTKDVDSYSIVAGVPAKTIGRRSMNVDEARSNKYFSAQ